jgi:hypothetical protein
LASLAALKNKWLSFKCMIRAKQKEFTLHQVKEAVPETGVFANTDMRLGEIRQSCRLQNEGQSLMRAATSGGAAVKADDDDRNVATRVGRCSQSFSKHHHAALE